VVIAVAFFSTPLGRPGGLKKAVPGPPLARLWSVKVRPRNGGQPPQHISSIRFQQVLAKHFKRSLNIWDPPPVDVQQFCR
jgi:hypothetical protein